MKVRLSLRGTGHELRNVEIETDVTATVGDVAAALASSLPANEHADQATLIVIDPATGVRRTLSPRVSLIDSRIESGVIVEVSPAGGGAGGPEQGAALVRVLSGPDRGIEVRLPFGNSTVGRAASCDVRLQDRSVSKQHIKIVVGSRIEVVDTNSANGMYVGGVQAARCVLEPDQIVGLGSTELTVTPLRNLAEASTTDVAFNRSPRVLVRPAPRALEVPEVPRPPESQSFPLIAMVAPLVLGVVFYAFTRSVLSVLFIGLSPVLMAGTWLSHVFEQRRQLRRAIAAFDAGLGDVMDRVARWHDEDRQRLLTLYPSVGACIEAVRTRSPLLWTRRPESPEFLQLRLGLGTVESRSTLSLRSEQGLAPQLSQARDAVAVSLQLHQAPVVADLPEVGCVGVTGSAEARSGVISSIVLQVASLHSPAEVVIACLTSNRGRARWDWLEWLPHCSSAHSPVAGPQLSADDVSSRLQLEALEGVVETRLKAAERGDRRDGDLSAMIRLLGRGR